MRIFCACLATETNTFSPIPTGRDDFDVVRQKDIVSGNRTWKDIQPIDLWRRQALARGDEFIFSLYAFAQPAGVTVRLAYENLRDEILSDLKKAGSVDLILLALHGAMVAEGYDDCEGDILLRIREFVGPEVVIAVELDLHCHLTDQMVSNADILITFKEYPHTDIGDRAKELFNLAVNAQSREIQPTMAVFDCRMMGMYPTNTPEMRDFIGAMMTAEAQKGVLSVSFVHGFPFGDVPEAGGKMLVVTDDDIPLAKSFAERLGKQIFSLRHRIGFMSLSLDEAFTKALTVASKNATQPVVVADQADNAGGGAPSDATYALQWLLDHKVKEVAVAILYDPQVVKLAKAAGVGARIKIRLGGKMGEASGNPLDLAVEVVGLQSNYRHRFPQQSADPFFVPLGDTVALHTAGIDIVVSSERCQCFSPCVFDDLGIPSLQRRLLVVKSNQHFYGAFAPIASEVIYMAAPGAVAPVMKQIPYQRMRTDDKFPWVDDPFAAVARIESV